MDGGEDLDDVLEVRDFLQLVVGQHGGRRLALVLARPVTNQTLPKFVPWAVSGASHSGCQKINVRPLLSAMLNCCPP